MYVPWQPLTTCGPLQLCTDSHVPQYHFFQSHCLFYINSGISDTVLLFLPWVWFWRNKHLEIFDALLGPTKLSAQLSVQTGNTQLKPLCTLNHLFYSVCVNNSAIQLMSYKGCEMNDGWRMAVMLNSCVEKSSITKKNRQRKGVISVLCFHRMHVWSLKKQIIVMWDVWTVLVCC